MCGKVSVRVVPEVSFTPEGTDNDISRAEYIAGRALYCLPCFESLP